jgi:hypothetical protein
MPTVLVVEDEVLIRDVVCEELADAGFGVIEVGTADEALRSSKLARTSISSSPISTCRAQWTVSSSLPLSATAGRPSTSS